MKDDSPDPWENRVEIRSETSNRIYVVAQHKEGRYWMCSCPGAKAHGACKHLKKMGLPGHKQPYEPPGKKPPEKKGFLDGYKEYDPARDGYGRPDEWRAAFVDAVGIDEAKATFGDALLGPNDGWAAVQAACGRVVASALEVLLDEYRRASRLVLRGRASTMAAAIGQMNAAKFKIDALCEYLTRQRGRLEAEAAKVAAALVESMQG